MFTFGETFFTEKVILNRDGTSREFISRFTEFHSDIYPFLFSFSVVTDLFFDEAFYKWFSLRIRGSGSKVIFEGSRQFILVSKPPHPSHNLEVIFTLENVEFPQAEDYTLYILLDDYVMHQDVLSFT